MRTRKLYESYSPQNNKYINIHFPKMQGFAEAKFISSRLTPFSYVSSVYIHHFSHIHFIFPLYNQNLAFNILISTIFNLFSSFSFNS